MTNSLRFPGQLNMEFREFQLLPIPALHFMVTSMSPILSPINLEHSSQRVGDLTGACFEPYNFFIELDDFQYETDPYMAMTVTFRGVFPAKEAFDAKFTKMMSRVRFSEHFGGSCKMSMTDRPICMTPWDEMAFCDRFVWEWRRGVGGCVFFVDRFR